MNEEDQTGQFAFYAYLWACGGLGCLFLSILAQNLSGFLAALLAAYICVYGIYHNYLSANKAQQQ